MFRWIGIIEACLMLVEQLRRVFARAEAVRRHGEAMAVFWEFLTGGGPLIVRRYSQPQGAASAERRPSPYLARCARYLGNTDREADCIKPPSHGG